jgi:hypothetical protein
MESDGLDTFSFAPRSQEGNILSHDEICSPVSSRRPQPSCALGGPPPSLRLQGEDDNPSAVVYRKRSDIRFTPFGVNCLKFPCLPHLANYLFPLILCRAQVW